MDPLKNRVTEMFGCEYPIFTFSPSRSVVAAVSRAGGFGVLAGTVRSPDVLADDIAWLKEQCGDAPFGIDLVFPASVPAEVGSLEDLVAQIPEEHHRFMDGVFEKNGISRPKPLPGGPRSGIATGGLLSQGNSRAQLDAVIDSWVPALFSGLGSPAFALEAAHAKKILVGGLVGKVRQAKRELEAGVDCIVAQGYDAGGHTGEIGTFSLVPRVVQVAREFDKPVLAAGGVATGAHIAGAMGLGAEGVWNATAFLASEESDFGPVIKEKMIAATEEDTVRTRALTGKPARMLRTKYTETWEAPDAPPTLPMPLQGFLNADLQAAVQEQDLRDWMGSPMGQGVGNVTEVASCAAIMERLVGEAREAFARMGVES